MTVPDGITKVRAVVLGGGGGGVAQDPYTAGYLQAGSGGGYSDKIYATSGGATISITVGAGGACPTASGGNSAHGNGGGAGGTSTVTIGGVSISATGGLGGIMSSSGTTYRGGTGSGGDINTTGGIGGCHHLWSNYAARNSSTRAFYGGGSSGTPWGDGYSGGNVGENYANNGNMAGGTGGGGWGGKGGDVTGYINGAGTGGGGAGGKAPDTKGYHSSLDYSPRHTQKGGMGRGCRAGTNESNSINTSQTGMIATPYIDGEDAYWFYPEDIGGGGGAGSRQQSGGAAGSGGAGGGGGGTGTADANGGAGNGGFGGGNGGCGAEFAVGGVSRPGNGGGHGCFNYTVQGYLTWDFSRGGQGGDGAVLIYW